MAKKKKTARKKAAGKKPVSKKKKAAKKVAGKKAAALKKKKKPAKKAAKKTKKKAATGGKAVALKKKKGPAKKAAARPRPGAKKSPPAQKGGPLRIFRKQVQPLHPTLIKIRDRLLQERLELFNILRTSKELERNVSELTFSNEIDLASSLEGREMAFTFSSRDRNELKLLEDALFKISEGTYGACESCSKQITLKRLQIMPLTAHCIDCQETMERP